MRNGVKAVITDHVKVSVGDMDNNTFNELKNGNGFLDVFVVFVAAATKRDEIVFISEDTFLSDDRSADIADHVVDDIFVVGKFSISVNVESIVFGLIQLGDERIETRGSDSVFKVKKQGGHKPFAQHPERDEIEFLKGDADSGSAQ
jgi:hypothetical protein